MVGILILLAFIVYCIAAWWVGFAGRRNWLIRSELEKLRRELKPGFTLAPSWYTARRKSGLVLFVLGVLGLAVTLGVAFWSYTADFRSYYILIAAVTAASPMLLGWWGVIPIPGIDIEL